MMNKAFPRIVCNDGFTLSVQARAFSYCTPRSDTGPWTEVEVGFPSEVEDLLLPFAEDSSSPTETVYGWVPVELVEQVIVKHGGTNRTGAKVMNHITGVTKEISSTGLTA